MNAVRIGSREGLFLFVAEGKAKEHPLVDRGLGHAERVRFDTVVCHPIARKGAINSCEQIIEISDHASSAGGDFERHLLACVSSINDLLNREVANRTALARSRRVDRRRIRFDGEDDRPGLIDEVEVHAHRRNSFDAGIGGSKYDVRQWLLLPARFF